MKVLLSWLKEYLNFSQSPEELANVLTLAGIEVEGIEASPLKFSGIVVGKVLSVEKHPSADRLCVAKVTDGKEEEFQVVLRSVHIADLASRFRFCQDWRGAH